MSAETGLPSLDEIRQAIDIYLSVAYEAGAPRPPAIGKIVPDPAAELLTWIMSRATERDPDDAPLEQVRSFALRLGNQLYPNMKLRISRPPNVRDFLFSVDAHDAFLHVPPESPDYEPLEQLKRHNAQLVDAITARWDAQNLPTERNYLRRKILEARQRKANP